MKIRYFLVHFFGLLFSLPILAQSYTISGYVKEYESKEPLVNAVILDTLSKQYTLSNEYGFYSLVLPKGKAVLQCSYVAYQNGLAELKVDGDITFHFQLNSTILDEVVVTNQVESATISSSQMSQLRLSIEQIKSIPAIGGESDILKAFALLPGISNNGEASTGLTVRGGSRDQNLILLDDAVVYNAAHAFGFLSVFNTDALHYADLIKGGFPARYGGRLSSVVNIKMKEGNGKKFKGQFGLGLINSKLTLEAPLSERSSFILSARSSYLHGFTFFQKRGFKKGRNDSFSDYWMYDINAKTNYQLNNKSKLYLSFYTGKDKFDTKDRITENTIQKIRGNKIYWQNLTTTLRLTSDWNPKLFSNLILSLSNYKYGLSSNTLAYEVNSMGNFVILNSEGFSDNFSTLNDLNAKIKFDFIPNNKHYIRFGATTTRHSYSIGSTYLLERQSSTDVNEEKENKVRGQGLAYALFFEDDITLNNVISTNIGARLSGFSVSQKNYLNIEPRLSTRFLLKKNWALKASYSFMVQYLHQLGSSFYGTPNDIWVTTSQTLAPQKAHQIAIGIINSLSNIGIDLSIEAFYKTMHDLTDYRTNIQRLTQTAVYWEDLIETGGQGRAYGLELFLEKKKGRICGFLSYTLSRNERTFENINKGRSFPFRYDRLHDFSVNVAYRISKKYEFNANWVFSSGLPFTIPTAKQVNGTGSIGEVLIYEKLHNSRMPAYHRLDLNVTFKKQTRKGRNQRIDLGIYNAYNQGNPFTVSLSNEGQINQNGEVVSYKSKLLQQSLFGIVPSITYGLEF